MFNLLALYFEFLPYVPLDPSNSDRIWRYNSTSDFFFFEFRKALTMGMYL